MAATLAAAGACASPEVEETLLLSAAGDGTSEITFEVTFPALDESADATDEARRDRVESLRLAYFEGWDRWAARFEGVGRGRETLFWERIDGELRRLVRTAQFDSPEALGDFFADTDLTVLLTPGPDESEIAFFTAPSSRATRDERERLAKLLAGWSRAAVDYLREVADLYAYLERNGSRADAIFEAIFSDLSDGLEGREERRIERLIETFVGVLEVAQTTDDAGESLERLARRVYDPFPARLSVQIDGRLIARQGFVELPEGDYEVPPFGLERALVELEARWIEPPLLTTYERLERLGETADFDAGEFARRPRRVGRLPTADEITEALEKELAPAPEYRLRWRPGGGEQPASGADSGRQR